jgi:hypothetical protein
MAAADGDVFWARPRRLRVIVVISTVALCALTLVGWYGLPVETRRLFTLSQKLTLLGTLATLLLIIVAVAASYVRADTDGLRIRNGLRRHTVPWGRVHKVLLRRGDPWALLLIKPADGRAFEADLDAEKRQLMGIQASDHELAGTAVAELRRRHQEYLAAR